MCVGVWNVLGGNTLSPLHRTFPRSLASISLLSLSYACSLLSSFRLLLIPHLNSTTKDKKRLLQTRFEAILVHPSVDFSILLSSSSSHRARETSFSYLPLTTRRPAGNGNSPTSVRAKITLANLGTPFIVPFLARSSLSRTIFFYTSHLVLFLIRIYLLEGLNAATLGNFHALLSEILPLGVPPCRSVYRVDLDCVALQDRKFLEAQPPDRLSAPGGPKQ